MAQPLQVQTETEIAILQVQFKNLDEKVDDLKTDVKDMRSSLEKHSKEHTDMMKAMEDNASKAHVELSKKISALEKWRWMLMGAGVVIGALGWPTIGKLLGH
jgi:predicted nuclease with TOPRIM domain